MNKRIFLPLFLCLSTAAVAASVESPTAALKQNVDQLQSLIAKHHKQYKSDPQSFYKVVNEVVVPRFDVPYIAQLVMGRYWRQATAQQREDFQHAFKDMLIHSYANALLENANSTTVEWLPSRYDSGDTRATVRTVLQRNNGQKYPIDFKVRLVDGSWKIYDIVIDNISLVLNFRTQITADLKRNGIEAVIAKLRTGHAQGKELPGAGKAAPAPKPAAK